MLCYREIASALAIRVDDAGIDEDDVAVLQRPEPLRTPVPDGLRRVLPTPARPR